jgi:hypothetical protein
MTQTLYAHMNKIKIKTKKTYQFKRISQITQNKVVMII